MKTSKKRLLEYTSGEFKFGWELEGCVREGAMWDAQQVQDVPDMILQDYHETFQPDKPTEWVYDTTIQPDKREDAILELKSSILPVDPGTFQKVTKWLYKIMDEYDFYINDSCGFHIHISWPHISPIDIYWVTCHIALDPKLFDKMLKFQEIIFESVGMANADFMREIKSAFESKSEKTIWATLIGNYGGDKLRNIRNHPQGTFEWRGPRKFIYPGDIETIKKMFTLTYNLVQDINRILENTDSLNGIISREEFYKQITNEKRSAFKKITPRKAGREYGKPPWMSNYDEVDVVEGAPDVWKVTHKLGKDQYGYEQYKVGLVNKYGKVLIPVVGDGFNQDAQLQTIFIRKFGDNPVVSVYDAKTGAVDSFKTGSMPTRYSAEFELLVIIKNNKYGVIGREGQIIIPVEYSGINQILPYNNQVYFLVTKITPDGKLAGVIDMQNKPIIPIQYESMGEVQMEWEKFMKGEGWGSKVNRIRK